MNRQRLKGHLPLLLLTLLESTPAHGYAVLEALRRRSGGRFDLPEGTVYPALHRLEASGLLHSRWEVIAGRRRRVYATSRKGQDALTREREAWADFSGAVAAVLGGTP
ncbi:MAG: PadR family transcriptional regulator [Gemmatimonadota bacterium]|nr:MAG: PadR family transcriptional regulator [Gemmatimonadota bacterium]